MQNKVACCFGHRDIFREGSDTLDLVVERLIVDENVKTFMTGGMGQFDSKFAASVRRLKLKHPDIELFLVLPYFSNALNTYKNYYEEMYDEIIVPDAVIGAHPKSAITKRNRWMAEKSDFIVGFVHRDFGGAYTAIKYARKLGKPIFNLAQEDNFK